MKGSAKYRRRPIRETIEELVDGFGKRYSTELGITLEGSKTDEVFKWFLASILFGARISEKTASKTYLKFIENNLKTPESVLRAGWDRLVEVLDSGGYARYDFKTAAKLLEVMHNLKNMYGGDLNLLHGEATGPRDLELKIKELGKGIGDVTVSIFLRELRGIWDKADPQPQDLAMEAARRLGFTKGKVTEESDRIEVLEELKTLWSRNRVEGRGFIDFETALVRYGKDVLKKRKSSKSSSRG